MKTNHNWRSWSLGEARIYTDKTVYELQSLCGNWRRRNPEHSEMRWQCKTVGSQIEMKRVR